MTSRPGRLRAARPPAPARVPGFPSPSTAAVPLTHVVNAEFASNIGGNGLAHGNPPAVRVGALTGCQPKEVSRVQEADAGGILCSPLITVARGFNVPPTAFEWQTIRPSDSNSSGKSAFLEAVSLLLIDGANLARKRALLVASSYEEATRQAARLVLTLKYAAHQSQPRAMSDGLRPTAAVDRRAVNGFDAPPHVLFSRRPQITELVQRVGSRNRLAARGDLLAVKHDVFDNAACVDDAEVSALVQLVRKAELRRLARIERHLALAWRRLIEGSRLRASARTLPPRAARAPSACR